MNPLLAVALLLFAAFLVFYAVQSVFLVYHLVKFSVRRESARLLVVVFLAVSAVLCIIILSAIASISWNAPAWQPFGLLPLRSP